MTDMIAYCGLDCLTCPAFIAMKEDDDEKRKATAEMWSKMYKAEIKPEDINCTGCHSTGIVFSHCNECPIRPCAQDKKLQNCAYCDDFTCEKLEGLLKYAPEARTKLEKIRKENKL